MTSMFAFPDMFAPHIKDSNLKQPEDFENYDQNSFHIFMCLSFVICASL